MSALLQQFDEAAGRRRFGDFEVDLDDECVTRDGARIPLQPQPFRLLRHFLTSGGRIVTREELKRTLWGSDTFVDFDRGLNFCVLQLRLALGDDARQPAYIATVPRKGYRFIAPVEAVRSMGGTRIRTMIAALVVIAASLALLPRLDRALPPSLNRHHDARAFDEYLQSRRLLAQRRTADIESAIRRLQNAVAIEPDFASAHVALAEAWRLLDLRGVVRAKDASLRIRTSVAAASAADPSLPAIHAVAGMRAFYYDWDFDRAERELVEALRANPSDGGARHDYAWLLLSRGQNAQAIAEIRRAQELDPLSPRATIDIAWICTYAGRYDEAILEAKRALEIDPEFGEAHDCLRNVYEIRGDLERAAAESGACGNTPARQCLTRLHERELAEVIADPGHDPYVIAQKQAVLGKTDDAFRWLDVALEQRSSSMPLLTADPAFASLRTQPRFLAVVKKVGLPIR